jgi:WD40 repeat protein
LEDRRFESDLGFPDRSAAIGRRQACFSLDLSPDGRLLAAGSFAGSVVVWDVKTGEPYGAPLTADTSPVNHVRFSPDGRLLALAVDPNGVDGFLTRQRKGEVQVWEVDSRRRTGRAIVPGTGSVFSVAFNHDGTLLATGSPGQLDLWDVATHARHVTTFDPAGSFLATTGARGGTRLWESRHGSRLRRRAGRQPEARLSPDLRRSAAPIGSPVSRDLLGVAHSPKRSLGGVDPAQTIRKSRPTGPHAVARRLVRPQSRPRRNPSW